MRNNESPVNYQYSLFGLRILSDFPLPELIPPSTGDVGEVVIQQGKVEHKSIVGAKQIGPFLWASADALYLAIPNIVTFIARGGREIIYEPADGIDEDSIRVYLFGSGIAAIMMQRGFLVLHGNAVETAEGVLICVGNSGAGKSTIAAAMLQRGHRIVADDVCVIDGEGYVIPGLPRIKLWQESADILGMDTISYRQIRPNMQKFNVPLGSSYCAEPRKVDSVVVLDQIVGDVVESEVISGLQKYELLHQNNFRPRYIKALGQQAEVFKRNIKFANAVSMLRLSRPRGVNRIDAIVRQLESLKCHLGINS